MSATGIDTVRDLADGLARGDFSSLELTDAALGRIGDDPLNAFVTVDGEGARSAARAADERRAAGNAGPLTGVPVAVKDIFCTEGLRTSCASRMLGDWVAPYDAHVVERLRDAGAVLVGKTNMDEFAMGSSGENSAFGATLNPWDHSRVPGGSSSGSAAAVAGGLVPAALGTDTGGSIRQPAAFCGLTGLKPTYGRVSRWGMIAFASSLDQGGPMAWSAQDLAMLLQQTAGFDERDSTCAEMPVPDYAAAIDAGVDGLVLGLPTSLLDATLAPEMQAAVDAARRVLEGLGVRFREIDLPTALAGVPAYYVLASAEASTNLSRFDGVRFGHRCEAPEDLNDLYSRSRAEGFGPEVKRRILTGTYALSVGYYEAYYRRAQKVRRRIRDEFVRAFDEVDAILCPTTPTPAFALGEKVDDPVAMYQQDLFTIPANLAGIPALSMPAGRIRGLPLGVQLLGPHFGEARLLSLAAAFQRETDHHAGRPAAGGTPA
jgi:aspartyl-tRNA(Asn)/glutamyl-tRNA(Gln) amidotransferase subunit A